MVFAKPFFVFISAVFVSSFSQAGDIRDLAEAVVKKQITPADKIINKQELSDGTASVTVKMGRGYITNFIVVKNGAIVSRQTY